MKKLLFLFLLIAFCKLCAQDASAVFNTESLVFYGLDFSSARLIGDFGNGDGWAMKHKMFTGWNELIAKEVNKYNVGEAFRKKSVYYDFNPVTAVNAKADEKNIRSMNEPAPFSGSMISEMVKNYPPGEKTSGIGLTMIVESFNKNKELATVNVTLFDIASKKILLTERMFGEPGGIGLRAYWANSIDKILKQISDHKYSEWQKK